MKTINKIIFCIMLCLIYPTVICAQVNEEIKPYVDFLKKEKPASAKDYILSLFKDHDIVILCERDHREMTQYDLILDVIKDPHFVNNVGVVFTEVGARNLNPELNNYLQNDKLTDEEINKQTLNFQRNCMNPLWEKPNFSKFIKGIHQINTTLPSNKKVKMEPTDVLFIEGEPNIDKYVEMINDMIIRDSLMADFIINKFDKMEEVKPKSKALIIMNYRHAYKYDVMSDNGAKSVNVGRLLFERYPGKIANVFINNYNNDSEFATINDGKWDAAFKAMNIENSGFDFENSPFGKDYFDNWASKNNYTYKDMFTGFVFYKPIEKFELCMGVPHLMEDGFYDEFVKRNEFYYRGIYKIRNIDKPVPTLEKEKIMSLNETQTSKLHTLDKVKASIEKWLK